MSPEQLEKQMNHILRNLVRDIEHASADTIASAAHDHYERISTDATVNDFIPLLVYRFTKEEFVSVSREELHHAA